MGYTFKYITLFRKLKGCQILQTKSKRIEKKTWKTKNSINSRYESWFSENINNFIKSSVNWRLNLASLFFYFALYNRNNTAKVIYFLTLKANLWPFGNVRNVVNNDVKSVTRLFAEAIAMFKVFIMPFKLFIDYFEERLFYFI